MCTSLVSRAPSSVTDGASMNDRQWRILKNGL
jgi:hypothetical protein